MRLFPLSMLLALGLQTSLAHAKCEPTPEPVVSVDLPSRYEDGSRTRSEIDEAANAHVNEVLEPVDKFVSILARQTTDALRLAKSGEQEKARVFADCVLAGLDRWAKADALSRLTSVNARLAIPSRMAGAAFAYALTSPLASRNESRRKSISAWLLRRANDTVKFFDDSKTPPRAAQNNLRTWGALTVLRTGLSTNEVKLVRWSEASFRRTLCTANKDGSLPLEMERGPLALHYQIHAIGPLVVGVALLKASGRDISKVCDNALQRVVGFTLDAIDDPALASAHAGVPQKQKRGKSSLEGHELAWIPAWQSLGLSPNLKSYAPAKMTLSNSKLGGNQTLVWEKPKS
jgi:poly(beta-D-mannuronate) lyase